MKESYQLPEDMIGTQQPYAYWLHRVERIGNAGKERLLSLFGSPKAVYGADRKALAPVLKEEQVEGLVTAKKQDVFEAYDRLGEQGISFYPFYHPAYPGRLREISDKPFGIYVKGQLPQREERSIAVIGARDCSEYGRYVAEQFAYELAQKGIAVISGMARGIDGIAQKAALAAGGRSYAVFGCGVEICYPSSHMGLYRELCEKGGILSEYPPGTKPVPGRFPPRNRIISGLSEAVLVIEARKKSGTLITVDMALEQGREVFIVPGRITDRLSDGCNSLIGQGASVALSPKQLLQELSEGLWNRENGGESAQNKKGGNPAAPHLSETERELLSLLDFYPVSLDQLRVMMQTKQTLCGITLSQTFELLVRLEGMGFLQSESGYYALKKPPA